MLAGIALGRLDVRIAAAAVLVFAILGAGDQQVIRSAGAHNWAYYPVGPASPTPTTRARRRSSREEQGR